ncbi:MAG: hypothetical protein JKY54_04955 [Flavobacteriales bacterium]|nr:hypothetical protein [Flavobacteriales bacterium]
MKKTLYAMALFSAFFVYSEPDMSDLKEPKMSDQDLFKYTCRINNKSCPEFIAPSGSDDEALQILADTFLSSISSGFVQGCQKTRTSSTGGQNYTIYAVCTFGNNQGQPDECTSTQNANISVSFSGSGSSNPTCPPDGFPEYSILVTSALGNKMCAKEKPTDSCEEFGNNSFLPPNDSLNVPSGGSVCYKTSGGSQCKYKKNPFGSGFEQTGQQCTGEETPYPEPDITPPNNPDNPNACATVGSTDPYAICPINENDMCNQIIIKGDGGDKVHQDCPAGCGSVNGQFVCAYPDKNGDGIPDENQDPQKGNDTKDPDDPNDDTPDSTKTNNLLYGLDKKLGVGNSRLTGIKTGIEGMTKEQIKGNGSLAAIASNTAKTANNTKGTSENTAEILKSISETDVSNTFNPESAASFYESEYEDGFGGVWQEKSGEFQQTEAYQFLQQFKFNGGGAAPDSSICFNLGQFMDFGCSELPVPDAGLLAILKVFILISAAFLCRRLIFGG